MYANNTTERGQVGIGTLIVFIAMVLVAAIAAGVLINTAGMLQTQAEATGEESTDLVSERMDVNSEVGIVSSNADNGELQSINITVTGAAGSSEIDLNETIIQAVGPYGQETLVSANVTGTENNLNEGESADATEISEGKFAIIDENADYVGSDKAVLGDEDDEFILILNPERSPFGDGTNVFGEGDESTLDIISPSGATTQVELRAPDLFNEGGGAVRL